MSNATPTAALDEDVVAVLRAALLAAEAEWKAVMSPLLQSRSDDIVGLQSLRAFMQPHAEAAGGRFRERAARMLEEIERSLRLAAENPLTLEAVAAEMDTLRSQKAALDEGIQLRRDALELVVGHGARRDLGRFRVSVSQPGVTLRVKDPAQVPAEYLVQQPDKKALLAHFKATGELLPGTDLTERKATVQVRAVAGVSGGAR